MSFAMEGQERGKLIHGCELCELLCRVAESLLKVRGLFLFGPNQGGDLDLLFSGFQPLSLQIVKIQVLL